MKAEYIITRQENPKPYAITVPRKVPLPLVKETKEEIQRMVQQGVISSIDEPTNWCTLNLVTNCKQCAKEPRQAPEPLITMPIPD